MLGRRWLRGGGFDVVDGGLGGSSGGVDGFDGVDGGLVDSMTVGGHGGVELIRMVTSQLVTDDFDTDFTDVEVMRHLTVTRTVVLLTVLTLQDVKWLLSLQTLGDSLLRLLLEVWGQLLVSLFTDLPVSS